MVHDGNKDEAEKCFNLAQKYFQEGNREKAIRFTQKAERLYPSQRSQEFLELLNRLSGTTGHTPHSNGTAGGEGDGGGGGKGGGTGSGENVRQRRTAATGEERTSSSANTTQSSSGTVEFTKEQVDSVKRIMRCKDYYEILGITKEATDSDLKKAYRKLALQFHPDKNKAPGASEAFKAVGNAFAVLSDPEKKKQYDLYGPEESNSPSQNRNSYNHHDFTRGYESDMTAEELFNMFFGGGYPGGNVYVRRGGRWERAGGAGGRSYNSQRGNQHQASHAEQSNLSVFLQLMPLLLILLLSLASSLLSSDPTYSLSPTSKYSVQRSTTNLGVSYYVKPDFSTEYQGSIRRLEQHVEEDYVSTLRNACFKEKNYKENMIWRARSFGDPQMFKRAQELRTPSCDSLQSLYS
ncbi:dnaJ homolog subfamily B member 12 isoform X2 [Procambarus clarkii]|uniref:dnaJ homolog subfamily B member 12 isoform X2 n=1 Tax=Procambarus clarkii TaxID=6728 RepID=UPI001E677252|nr:dnaJ homolog subfamily B member 12-like isoform X2 [Procambarus clarkii]